jgi:hypothetical protein
MLILFAQRLNLENLMQTHAVYVGNFSDNGAMCEACFQAIVCWFGAASETVGGGIS